MDVSRRRTWESVARRKPRDFRCAAPSTTAPASPAKAAPTPGDTPAPRTFSCLPRSPTAAVASEARSGSLNEASRSP